MTVFVWNSYGDTEVYAIETVEQIKKIYENMKSVLRVCDEAIEDSEKILAKITDEYTEEMKISRYKIAINNLTTWYDKDEDFDYGSGFVTIQQ